MRRVLEVIPLMFSVVVVAFLLIHLAHGDPFTRFVSAQAVDPEYLAKMRASLGLDKPLHVQFYIHLSRLLRGDFRYSIAYSAPALTVVLDKLLDRGGGHPVACHLYN